MVDDANLTTLKRGAISRPQAIIDAEQQRHDNAQRRGLIAFFAALVVGGGIAFLIESSAVFRNQNVLRAILECGVFLVPVAASFIVLCRVLPKPFESVVNSRPDIDRKVAQWRWILVSQIFTFGIVVLDNFWLWHRFPRNWMFALVALFPNFVMVLLAISSLYMSPGWFNADLRVALDDEVTWSFRTRAQRLGYLVMLFILLGFAVLAQIRPVIAAHFLPLGLASGIALPILYFVYLDWQASRSG